MGHQVGHTELSTPQLPTEDVRGPDILHRAAEHTADVGGSRLGPLLVRRRWAGRGGPRARRCGGADVKVVGSRVGPTGGMVGGTPAGVGGGLAVAVAHLVGQRAVNSATDLSPGMGEGKRGGERGRELTGDQLSESEAESEKPMTEGTVSLRKSTFFFKID